MELTELSTIMVRKYNLMVKVVSGCVNIVVLLLIPIHRSFTMIKMVCTASMR